MKSRLKDYFDETRKILEQMRNEELARNEYDKDELIPGLQRNARREVDLSWMLFGGRQGVAVNPKAARGGGASGGATYLRHCCNRKSMPSRLPSAVSSYGVP